MKPKWDGYRAVVIRGGGAARIWSRQRNDLTERFRDIGFPNGRPSAIQASPPAVVAG